VFSRHPQQDIAASVEVLWGSVTTFDFDLRFRRRDCFVTGRAPLTGTRTAEHPIGLLEGEHPVRELRPDPGVKLIVGEVLYQGV
jgi:hypothetical protein